MEKNHISEAQRSKSSGIIRDARDFYPTPEWCVTELYREFPLLPHPTLEPCAGIGSLVDPIIKNNWNVPLAIELDPELAERHPHVKQGDGLALDWTGHHVLMNPPYKDALTWIEKGLAEAESLVALLRLGFLASKRRHALFKRFPPYALGVLSKRPSFRHGRTDSSEYAWFIWTRWQGDHRTDVKWLIPR